MTALTTGLACEGCRVEPATELVLAVTTAGVPGGGHEHEQRMDAELVGLCGGCVDAAAELGLLELMGEARWAS